MSGRRKGKRGEREGIRLLRALGLDGRGVRRERDAAHDIDAVIFLHGKQEGQAIAVQIKREERPRPGRWAADFVGPGRVVLYRLNRGPWMVIVLNGFDLVETVSLLEFAAAAKRGMGVQP